MESRLKIEIALRAGMVSYDILSLLRISNRDVMRITLQQAQNDLDELKKIVATVA